VAGVCLVTYDTRKHRRCAVSSSGVFVGLCTQTLSRCCIARYDCSVPQSVCNLRRYREVWRKATVYVIAQVLTV
jgi:hypothetical protein